MPCATVGLFIPFIRSSYISFRFTTLHFFLTISLIHFTHRSTARKYYSFFHYAHAPSYSIPSNNLPVNTQFLHTSKLSGLHSIASLFAHSFNRKACFSHTLLTIELLIKIQKLQKLKILNPQNPRTSIYQG